jgi:chromosomal replication initiator protein
MPSAAELPRVELQRSWRSVVEHLSREMNPHTFETWVRGTEPLRFENQQIIIEARHGASCDWLNGQLSCIINRAVATVLGDGVSASFVPRSFAPAAPVPAQPRDGDGTPSRPMPVSGRSVLGALNPQFTFERYLRTAGNAVALQACLDLIGTEPQPSSHVVLYGQPGIGKTHLLHALAARASSQGWAVACLGAEEFTNRYQSAIRSESVQSLQELLRSVRLLVIDDLQYFPGRTGTITEFVNTWDAVTHAGGFVVCASECHPGELNLPPRLISRLKGGVLGKMGPLTSADRRAYVDARVREQRLSLPSWALDRVASCEVSCVRILQGAVNTALVLQRTGELTLGKLDAHLVEFCATASAAPQLGLRETIEAVAAYFELTFEDLTGRARARPVADARAAAMAALIERGQSLSQVSALFGNRHRSTVKEASDRGHKILEANPALHERLAAS